MTDWKKTANKNIRKLSVPEALDILKRIADARRITGPTMYSPEIRDLTGGFNSQAINYTVLRLLGKKVGICR
jgi:hypothetical protein